MFRPSFLKFPFFDPLNFTCHFYVFFWKWAGMFGEWMWMIMIYRYIYILCTYMYYRWHNLQWFCAYIDICIIYAWVIHHFISSRWVFSEQGFWKSNLVILRAWPRWSIYRISTYIWAIFGANVDTYSIKMEHLGEVIEQIPTYFLTCCSSDGKLIPLWWRWFVWARDFTVMVNIMDDIPKTTCDCP